MELITIPERLSWRPLTPTGVPVPYNSHITPEGKLNWGDPSQEMWFECIKHKRCAYCGMPTGYWLHFLVTEEQLETFGGKYFFTDPPMHPECALYMFEVMKGVVQSDERFRSFENWAIYVTRQYRIATLRPPPEARAMGAGSMVRINPAAPKEIRKLKI